MALGVIVNMRPYLLVGVFRTFLGLLELWELWFGGVMELWIGGGVMVWWSYGSYGLVELWELWSYFLFLFYYS